MEAKEKWLTHLFKVVNSIEASRVFGEPLTKNKELPPFLKRLLAYLQQTVLEMTEEELTRIAGSAAQIQRIKQDADHGKNVEFSTPSLAAYVLKVYLRELPEALLSELRCWFLELAAEEASSELKKLYQVVISSVPSLHKEVLKELIRLFYNLCNRKEHPYKISPRSIGITFGSSLFYGKGDVEPADLQLVTTATEYMVTHYAELFEITA